MYTSFNFKFYKCTEKNYPEALVSIPSASIAQWESVRLKFERFAVRSGVGAKLFKNNSFSQNRLVLWAAFFWGLRFLGGSGTGIYCSSHGLGHLTRCLEVGSQGMATVN